MECLITNGVGISCEALRRVGGVNKRAYLFNIDDLSSVTFDSNGYIDQLNFDVYSGLYNFISRKQAHSGGYTAQIQAPGGNKFFQHDVILKMFPDNPDEDSVLENLLVASVGIILEDNNREFFLYGKDNGMDQLEGAQNSGQENASDMSYSLTFNGQEQEIPKRILITDYNTTKDYLNSLVI